MYLTIPGFENMSSQEVFDMSARHLLRQGELCQNEDETCLYRGENGRACAAGVFLTDGGAKAADNPKEMLGHVSNTAGWEHLVLLRAVPDNHAELIKLLQCVHDETPSHRWRYELEELARNSDLSDAVCHEPI